MMRSVAVVTGAGRGIGRAVAITLSEAGYALVISARSRAELDETADLCRGDVLVVPGDITSPDFVDELFTRAEDELGPVDVLIANAGAGHSAPVHTTSDEDWQRMLDLNLTAPFRCVRRALPGMLERRFGRIVVIASVAAKIGEPYIAAYTASKHGVLGMVRSAAAEVARKGVTVNAVCPGYVDTPMTETTIASIVEKTGRTAQEARAALEAKQPNGRLVSVDEVAAAVLACVTNAAINGQGINVDGGGTTA